MDELDWRDGNVPVSTRFDDPYYSRQDGRSETRHVFIEGNNLPQRWKNCPEFTVAELGFGTGLNFLETADQWQKLNHGDARLQFVSFEQYPISSQALEKALSAWPELGGATARLLEIWDGGRKTIDTEFYPNVRLTVHMGDANIVLPEQRFAADAWYLDGFSPAKNRELWNEELMMEVGRHTVAGGTFATYTVAGFVRRGLQAAGFDVEKTAGFGPKREMLCGHKLRDIHVADRH